MNGPSTMLLDHRPSAFETNDSFGDDYSFSTDAYLQHSIVLEQWTVTISMNPVIWVALVIIVVACSFWCCPRLQLRADPETLPHHTCAAPVREATGNTGGGIHSGIGAAPGAF